MIRWTTGTRLRDRVEMKTLRDDLKMARLGDKIREKRLRWYGHVYRRENDHMCKKMLNYEPKGRRDRGRPTLRWTEVVRRDMNKLGLNTRATKDREKWKTKTDYPDPK